MCVCVCVCVCVCQGWAILKFLHAIIVKQEYHDYSVSQLFFPLYFTENWLQTCQTVLKCGKIVTIITILDNYCSLRLLFAVKIGRY